MTLDEIERLARTIMGDSGCGPIYVTNREFDLARAVLAMLPVVRAAMHLCGPGGIDNPPPILKRAVYAMRKAER